MGEMYKQGVGISLTGVGNKATHNLIHDGPRMGIMFSGNNLLLEYNEIRHVNLETEDTGAVYTGGRDWISSRGSVIRYNYFHDILGYGQMGADAHFTREASAVAAEASAPLLAPALATRAVRGWRSRSPPALRTSPAVSIAA